MCLMRQVRDLWVEAAPHEPMVYVKSVRMWQRVETAAESGALSTRLTESQSVQSIRWDMFGDAHSGLVHECLRFLLDHLQQSGANIRVNYHVLALLQLLGSLIGHGFCAYRHLCDEVLPTLLTMMDGRHDVAHGGEAAPSRLEVHVRSSFDTRVVMEAKVALCTIMQYVYTMQLDVRLSQLLLDYKGEWGAAPGTRTCGAGAPRERPHGERRAFFDRTMEQKWKLSSKQLM